MNAPIAPEHLTPELHEALGRVTLDENTTHRAVFQRRLICAERKLRRSYKHPDGAAGGFVGERGLRIDAPIAPEHLTPELHEALRDVTLDKYTLERGRVYLTGTQALVRLPMLQRQRDVAGRPQHRRLHLRLSRLAARRPRPGAVEGEEAPRSARTSSSSPGVNEDLAATAVWGTQQVNLFPGAKYDGVFAHVVRQGPGRRPLRRRVQARQRRRHVASTAACWCWPATTTRAKSSTLPHQSRAHLRRLR